MSEPTTYKIILHDIVADVVLVPEVLRTTKDEHGEAVQHLGEAHWWVALRNLEIRIRIGSERPALERGQHLKITLEALR